MSERKSVRQDYILRVRYQNTLPPPPFEPKFVKLPDYSSKYTSATFMSTLVQEQPPTLEIDPELGMPLDLSRVPGVFEGDDSLLYAPEVPQELDPRDRRLLKSADGTPHGGAPLKDVAYLRRTQYISSELSLSNSKGQQRQKEAAARQRALAEEQRKRDLDPDRQVAAVDATFAAANTPLATLVHPARDKRHLKAVASYAVLPDAHFSPLDYVNIKFTTDPAPRGSAGERAADVDSKLATALVCPKIRDDGTEFISYFLADDAAQAEALLASNRAAGATAGATANTTGDQEQGEQKERPADVPFSLVRDYEGIKNAVADDYAIVLCSRKSTGSGSGSGVAGAGVARYVQLESRMTMRGQRVDGGKKSLLNSGSGGGVAKKRELYKLTLRKLAPEEAAELTRRAGRYGTPEQIRQYKELEAQRLAEEAAAVAAEEAAAAAAEAEQDGDEEREGEGDGDVTAVPTAQASDDDELDSLDGKDNGDAGRQADDDSDDDMLDD